MKQEIERKYAVKYLPNDFKIESVVDIEQGFIYKDLNTIIRIRKIQKRYPHNEISYIYTLKTKGDINYNSGNISKKYEIENEIRKEEYEKLIKKKISNIINKTRILIPIQDDKKVEMDVYYDYLDGLLTAEIEFQNEEDAESFQKPCWLDKELGYRELSNRKLSEMTQNEWKSKVTKEFIENNNKIICELKEKILKNI